MTIQITVIGLGQIGASFGLALADHKDKVLRCGHDPELTRAKKMEKAGAFDKTFYNLPESVRDADVVILALPVDQVEETLKYIAEDLRAGAVVIDTSPIRTGISDWVKKYLPADRHYVAMMPVINATFFDAKHEERDLPNADLFKDSEMIIATESTTHPNAVKLASDLANLVGAKAYFVDPLEADGICAKTELLPKLVSSALLMATLKQPGWQDSRRLTTIGYEKATEAVEFFEESTHPSVTALLNGDNTIMAINTMISSLVEIRDLIASKDAENLDALLKDLQESRAQWAALRKTADWEPRTGDKPPTAKEMMGGLFGVRPKVLKKK